MKRNQLPGTLLTAALLFIMYTSCKKEIKNDNETVEELASSASVNSMAAENDLLQSVRNATSKYHSTTQAINGGYVADDHCVSVPGLGGMGYHWANPSLVDPTFDPLKPEVVLYAKGPGGNLRLVALEYIVINVGQPRPSFDGHLFDVGGTPVPVPHWSLHVWLYETNPSGIFVPFNPNISCQ